MRRHIALVGRRRSTDPQTENGTSIETPVVAIPIEKNEFTRCSFTGESLQLHVER
jgi:hypothetical protein